MKEYRKSYEFELFDNKYRYENGKLKIYTEVFFDYVPINMVKISADELQLVDNIVKSNG